MFARSHSIKDHPGQLVGTAGLAAALGAIGAVLFTPKRGSEVRQDIRERGKRMKDKMSHMKDTKERAKVVARRGKQTSGDMADEIRRKGEP
ncbi:MAG TPA: YtxH domain-containing protein [Verrucomicrobiae bacterium]|nr:YtxH domain-containing protein [Verrucomicrobiae bacterium]